MHQDLQKACRVGDTRFIQQILKNNRTQINTLDSKLGWSPLFRTVICNQTSAVKLLLQLGADPNVKNRMGETPLHQASGNNQVRIVKLLLRYQADSNIQQSNGFTALHNAVLREDSQIIQLLLQYQANPNIPCAFYGKTPLHYAVENRNKEIVKMLFEYGASPFIRDKQGNRAIDYTDSQKMKEILSQQIPQKDALQLESLGTVENRISYDNIKMNDLTLMQEDYWDLQANKFEFTIEPEGEKILTPLADSVKIAAEIINKPALFNWLQRNSLQECYNDLIINGYDDLNQMIQLMKSDWPITLDILKQIGIQKPGHRRFLLCLLQKFSLQQPKIPQQGCCSASTRPSLTYVTNLQDWLEDLRLPQLYPLFIQSGYDNLDNLLLIMKTPLKLTEQLLQDEIGIDKLGHRHRLLTKLQEDSNRGLTIEEDTLPACRMCIIM